MEPVVIFDQAVEMAALVDTDSDRALGPIAIGPNAQGELTQFAHMLTPTLLEADSVTLTQAWQEFWMREFAPLYETPAAPDNGAVESPGGVGDNETRLAEATATASAGNAPPPAPADADHDAASSAADAVATGTTPTPPAAQTPEPEVQPYEGPCFACNGSGQVAGATEGERAVCNLCKGTGHLPVEVPA